MCSRKLLIRRGKYMVMQDLDEEECSRLDGISMILKIANGNFGTVFKGVDQQGEAVAIKRIRIEKKSAFLRATCREIRILSKVKHKNILKLNRVLQVNDYLYIITNLYFRDLGKIIQSDALYSKIRPDDLLHIIFQLLCGLEYLHTAGVSHRDIKPANIILDYDMTVKIGDFGSARSIDESIRQPKCHTSALADNPTTREWYKTDENGNTHNLDLSSTGKGGSAASIASSYCSFLEGSKLTDYVVTRWYRAPEIICSSGGYGFAQVSGLYLFVIILDDDLTSLFSAGHLGGRVCCSRTCDTQANFSWPVRAARASPTALYSIQRKGLVPLVDDGHRLYLL